VFSPVNERAEDNGEKFVTNGGKKKKCMGYEKKKKSNRVVTFGWEEKGRCGGKTEVQAYRRLHLDQAEKREAGGGGPDRGKEKIIIFSFLKNSKVVKLGKKVTGVNFQTSPNWSSQEKGGETKSHGTGKRKPGSGLRDEERMPILLIIPTGVGKGESRTFWKKGKPARTLAIWCGSG